MAKLELDASKKGWRCSSCGLFVDSIGRPIFGHEPWTIQMKTNTWLENKPAYRFCPGCGEPIERSKHGKKDRETN